MHYGYKWREERDSYLFTVNTPIYYYCIASDRSERAGVSCWGERAMAVRPRKPPALLGLPLDDEEEDLLPPENFAMVCEGVYRSEFVW